MCSFFQLDHLLLECLNAVLFAGDCSSCSLCKLVIGNPCPARGTCRSISISVARLKTSHAHHLEPLSGLNYQQFLRYICVEIGSRIDDRSEFHSIFAFVRRCVGTYDDESGSSSSSGDEGTDSGVRR